MNGAWEVWHVRSAAIALCSECTSRLDLELGDADLQSLIVAWYGLPTAIGDPCPGWAWTSTARQRLSARPLAKSLVVDVVKLDARVRHGGLVLHMRFRNGAAKDLQHRHHRLGMQARILDIRR